MVVMIMEPVFIGFVKMDCLDEIHFKILRRHDVNKTKDLECV